MGSIKEMNQEELITFRSKILYWLSDNPTHPKYNDGVTEIAKVDFLLKAFSKEDKEVLRIARELV